MSQIFEAVFDGVVLHPDEPLQFQANTRVRITVVEVVPPAPTDKPRSFLQTAQTLQLDGPPEWSASVDRYLHEGEQAKQDG